MEKERGPLLFIKKSWKICIGLMLGIALTVGILVKVLVRADEPDENIKNVETNVGDADNDGKITPRDVTVIKRHIVGNWNIELEDGVGDVDTDGLVTPTDVSVLKKYLTGGQGIELSELPDPEGDEETSPAILVETVELEADTTDIVTVNVSIRNNPGICSLWLAINYDPDLILIEATEKKIRTVDDVEKGIIDEFETGEDITANPFIVSWDDSANRDFGEDTYDGEFLSLTFKVKEEAEIGKHKVWLTFPYPGNSAYDIEETISDRDFILAEGGIDIVPSVFEKQPENTTVNLGELAYFSVKTTHDDFGYLWQYKEKDTDLWVDWTTKTSPEITVAYAPYRNGMSLRCVATDFEGNLHISKEAVLNYVYDPSTFVITLQPQDTRVQHTELAYFSVKAEGYGLTYLWQYKLYGSDTWKDWHSKNTADISVAYSSIRDGMSVRCMITDINGNSIFSDEAVLNYGDETTTFEIITQPQDVSVLYMDMASFNVSAQGRGLKYLWQYKMKGSDSWIDWTTKTTAEISVAYAANRNGMSLRCVITDMYGNTLISDEAVLTYTSAGTYQYEYASSLTGKVWYCIGDSYTHGDFSSITPPVFTDGMYAGQLCVYPFYIGNRTGIKVHNLAVNGATMTVIPSSSKYQWAVDEHYQLVGEDADIVTIWIGVNDMFEGVPIGTIDSEDETTFYGAYNKVLKWLIVNRPYAKIGIVASFLCDEGFCTAVKNLGAKYGVPVLNFYDDPDLPVSIWSKRTDVSVEVKDIRHEQYAVSKTNYHPSAKFHELESYYIEEWLKTL